jgi:5-hydroxyisourate hydrolase-like protein (transthyretin family)
VRLFAIFCLFLFLATTLCLNAQTGCMGGQVLDTRGNPIHSLSVFARKSDHSYMIEVTTDSDGQFSMTELLAGAYQVFTSDETKAELRHLDFRTIDLSSAAQVQVADGDLCATVNLRRALRARLQLHATNILTGEKIDSADGSFRLSGDSSWQGHVEGGEILVPPLTNFELQLGARGYETAPIQQLSPLQPGEVREIAAALRPLQVGCIAGTVLDQQGIPVSDIRIQLIRSAENLRFDPGVKSTEKNGRFKFEGLQPGDYFVFTHAELLGYVPGLSQGSSEYSVVAVEPGGGCSATTISLGPKAAKLEVTVVDATTQTAMPEAAVWLSGNHSNGFGGWSLKAVGNPVLAPSLTQFQLSAGAKGYQTRKMDMPPLQPEEVQKVVIQLQPEGKKATR